MYTVPANLRPASGAVRVEDGGGRCLARVLARLHGGLPRWDGLAAGGEELHPMAMLDARLQRLAGRAPQQRVWRRRVVPAPRLAVQLLLDASASTAQVVPAGGTVLAGLLTLALACAEGLEVAGHQVALMSFASRTRERIEVRRLKDWQEASSAAPVRARCRSLESGGSTRLGAALRHAVACAMTAASRSMPTRPLVLVLTDGDVHDIDAPDPAYLHGDLRRAVAEAERAGVGVRCLEWDAGQGKGLPVARGLRVGRIRSARALPGVLLSLLAA